MPPHHATRRPAATSKEASRAQNTCEAPAEGGGVVGRSRGRRLRWVGAAPTARGAGRPTAAVIRSRARGVEGQGGGIRGGGNLRIFAALTSPRLAGED